MILYFMTCLYHQRNQKLPAKSDAKYTEVALNKSEAKAFYDIFRNFLKRERLRFLTTYGAHLTVNQIKWLYFVNGYPVKLVDLIGAFPLSLSESMVKEYPPLTTLDKLRMLVQGYQTLDIAEKIAEKYVDYIDMVPTRYLKQLKRKHLLAEAIFEEFSTDIPARIYIKTIEVFNNAALFECDDKYQSSRHHDYRMWTNCVTEAFASHLGFDNYKKFIEYSYHIYTTCGALLKLGVNKSQLEEILKVTDLEYDNVENYFKLVKIAPELVIRELRPSIKSSDIDKITIPAGNLRLFLSQYIDRGPSELDEIDKDRNTRIVTCTFDYLNSKLVVSHLTDDQLISMIGTVCGGKLENFLLPDFVFSRLSKKTVFDKLLYLMKTKVLNGKEMIMIIKNLNHVLFRDIKDLPDEQIKYFVAQILDKD